jgi:capsular polysaccharide export protein
LSNFFSVSHKLTTNTKNFINIEYYTLLKSFFNSSGVFYGWGRKESGLQAVLLAQSKKTSFVLLEDGFIRSLGLGVNGSPSFSIIEDDIGIYYDATAPSKLENILNYNDFDDTLISDSIKAKELIVKENISKYNNSKEVPNNFFTNSKSNVLVIAQTEGDASLLYGMLEEYSTDEMIDTAISENPDSTVYLKVHPDVLSGKKKSDINIENAKEKCIIINENYSPISLLKYFDKVYTKTSQMGFEALLVGCECVCFGMPFYAGWGVTDDRSYCARRKRKLTVDEIFAAAYILYTRYYNPYEHRDSDIFDTIETIIRLR